jgi:hypothetical protein
MLRLFYAMSIRHAKVEINYALPRTFRDVAVLRLFYAMSIRHAKVEINYALPRTFRDVAVLRLYICAYCSPQTIL